MKQYTLKNIDSNDIIVGTLEEICIQFDFDELQEQDYTIGQVIDLIEINHNQRFINLG